MSAQRPVIAARFHKEVFVGIEMSNRALEYSTLAYRRLAVSRKQKQMRLDVDVLMEYQVCRDESVLLTIEAAATGGQSLRGELLEIENATLHHTRGEGLVGTRVWALVVGEQLKLNYRAQIDITRSAVALSDLRATPLHQLPSDVVPYLHPSRFCQSDLFTAFVFQHFGHLKGGAKVTAMLEWVAAEIAYVPGSSTAATTAIDTFVARAGVCRDYTHLLCSFARAANIPARYTSAYGAFVQPQDFHAVAEIWLDGMWHLIDATGMSAATNLAVIASGRDACDVAFMETEDWAQLTRQSVSVTQL